MERYAIGIDLGGTSVKYAVVASSGKMPFSGQLPAFAQESAEAVLGQVLKGVEACREYAVSEGLTLAGVGVGTPGVVSADGRTVLGGAENIAGWENIPLAGRVEEAEGLKTLAGNDANMMALGETLFGAAKGATDVVFVTVGTGIGCGALIDGRLYRGYRNRGMEMGHITVKCDGEGCACGGVGCLEHYASTSALVRRFCELNGSARDAEVDGKDVVLFYKEGNPAAVQAMEEHWNYLAHGIASMINLFAPQRVVVGGGISEAGDFYLEKLREGVRRQMMSAPRDWCWIKWDDDEKNLVCSRAFRGPRRRGAAPGRNPDRQTLAAAPLPRMGATCGRHGCDAEPARAALARRGRFETRGLPRAAVAGQHLCRSYALGAFRMGGLCLPRAAGRRPLVLAVVRHGTRRCGALVGGQCLHGRCFVQEVRHSDG